MISADKAIPLGLLINELVTNAVKHAYPDGSGKIDVSGEQRGQDLHVDISDQGIGLPKDFDIDEPRASLGFKVIKSLLDAGVMLVFSSDAPVSAFQPLISIEASVAEQTGTGQPYAPQEAISVEDGIRRYVHLGTGNYNPTSARLYTDLGLFTCNEEIGADVSDLFNHLTGYSAKKSYRKLLVAPQSLRSGLERLIRLEIERHREHGDGHLIFKMNALEDPGMIRLLYEASQAGVEIDLIVRGVCSLRPGVPGVSETIRVKSILGRFLEHSRIYYFHNGGDEKFYLGSADLMPRNLNRRVEVLFPVEDRAIARRLHDKIIAK